MKASLSALVVAATVAGAGVAAQRATTFRSSAEVVSVYASVRDNHGQVVRGLRRSDFEILDDGQRRDIATFSDAIQPTTVGLLLDRSGSVSQLQTRIADAAKAFLADLIPEDRASLSLLTWDCQSITSDKARLASALDDGLPVDLGSPIWMALGRVMTSLDVEPGRRAVLVLSDGDDTGPQFDAPGKASSGPCQPARSFLDVAPADIVGHARREGTLVYAMRVRAGSIARDATLRMIAAESGGESYALDSANDLTPAFKGIAADLHQQYLLGFVPAAFDDRVHTIQVRVKRPGAIVRARKTYLASHARRPGAESDARVFDERAPWPELSDAEVRAAVEKADAGAATAACTAAAVFDSPVETSASVRIVARGPYGRIADAAAEARRTGRAFDESSVSAEMRAPDVTISAEIETGMAAAGDSPAALSGLDIHGRGVTPIVLSPLAVTPLAATGPRRLGGLRATYAMIDFKGLPGADIEVVARSPAGDRRCRFSKTDVQAIR